MSEITNCSNCGVLHDPDDGACLGCKIEDENSQLKQFVTAIFDHDRLSFIELRSGIKELMDGGR